jgi:hypothetical protein
MTEDAGKPLPSMDVDELHALIDRCRHEERRTRDAGRRQEWALFRQDAEAELARRSGHPPGRPARGPTE